MTIEDAAEFLKAHDDYLITPHDGPDADGLGAAYALALALASIGKRAIPILGEEAPAKYRFMDQRGLFFNLGKGDPLPFDPSAATFIVVDTHDLGYLGERIEAIMEERKDLLVLDHHEAKVAAKPFQCIDSGASSTCELVYRLGLLIGADFPLDAAEAIFCGLVYDTGSFAYPKTGSGTFACALALVEKGVKPYVIHNRMYESASIGVLILQKMVLSSLELRLENRVAVQTLRRSDLAASGASYEDAEDLINLPLRGRAVEVSLLFKENLEGKLRCSLRSKGLVNVAHIAQTFGGGGHKTAAGFTCDRPLDSMKEAVLENIVRSLDESAARPR